MQRRNLLKVPVIGSFTLVDLDRSTVNINFPIPNLIYMPSECISGYLILFKNISFFDKVLKISVRIWIILGSTDVLDEQPTSRGYPDPADQFLDVQKWSFCCLRTFIICRPES